MLMLSPRPVTGAADMGGAADDPTGVRLRLGYDVESGCVDLGIGTLMSPCGNGGGVTFLGLETSRKADGGAGERRAVGGGAEMVGGGGARGRDWIGEGSVSMPLPLSSRAWVLDCPRSSCLTSVDRSPCFERRWALNEKWVEPLSVSLGFLTRS